MRLIYLLFATPTRISAKPTANVWLCLVLRPSRTFTVYSPSVSFLPFFFFFFFGGDGEMDGLLATATAAAAIWSNHEKQRRLSLVGLIKLPPKSRLHVMRKGGQKLFFYQMNRKQQPSARRFTISSKIKKRQRESHWWFIWWNQENFSFSL